MAEATFTAVKVAKTLTCFCPRKSERFGQMTAINFSRKKFQPKFKFEKYRLINGGKMSVKERIAELFKNPKQTANSILKEAGRIFSVFTITTALAFTIVACTPDSKLTADDPHTPGIENPGEDVPGIDVPGTEEPGVEEPGTEEPSQEIVVGDFVNQVLSEEKLQNYCKEAFNASQMEFLKKKFPDLENPQASGEIAPWSNVGEEMTQGVVLVKSDATNVLAYMSADSDVIKNYMSEIEALMGGDLVQKILDIAGVDENATIKESEKGDLINKLDSATAQYLQSVDSLASELTDLVDLIQLKQVANFVSTVDATEQVSVLFGGAQKLYVGEFTQSMPYTAGGNITTANCQMANVFTVESDGSVKAYAVTVEEGKTDLSGNVDVAEVGSFALGTAVENLPELSQPEVAQEVSFDSLYNEVFGDGYDLVPFETFFNELTDKVFDVASEYKIQFMQLSENGFKLYADCVNEDRPNHRLDMAIYDDAGLSMILDYLALSEEVGEEASLKDYLQSTFSTNGKVNANDVESVKTELNTYKTRTDSAERIRKFTNKTSFYMRTLISNTTADINFDDYAKEYTPEGATPIACYVGAINPKTLDNSFGTGYVQWFDGVVVYQENNNTVVVKSITVGVPWYTNSTDDYSYSLALGEEGKDYEFTRQKIIVTLEDPIISPELLPNETSREF